MQLCPLHLLIGIVLAQIGCAGFPLDEIPPDPQQREDWESRIMAGEVAAKDHRFEVAEREFLDAVQAVSTIPGNESLLIATLRRLARLYIAGGRPDAAGKAMEQALRFSQESLGSDHPETLEIQTEIHPRSVSIAEKETSPAATFGLPTSMADETSAEFQDEEKNEFSNNINLWPILEWTTLPTGEERSAFWPLFHVTRRPKGGIYSWHVLNFLKGQNYHMLLPLYYSIDDDLGIVPPVFLMGKNYWASLPLLSGSWGYADGDRATWITPLFHQTSGAGGELRSLHAALYFQGERYWALPPALSGGWSYPDGTRTTWVTPLIHQTISPNGDLESLHAAFFLEGQKYWALPPLLSWHTETSAGMRVTWATPLFHWTTDQEGNFVSTHMGPYFQGKDYWLALPLAGGGTNDDGSSTTWITPLFHLTEDSAGNALSYHVGPYLEGKDWWSIPPLLTYGWKDAASDRRMTAALLFWLHTDQGGLVSSTLFPLYFWVRDSHWFIPPLFAGHWGYPDKAQTTWITPLFHRTTLWTGEVDSMHVGPYFQGKDYWAVPPLLSWHVKYPDNVAATWLTPLFHLTTDPEGDAESFHLFPAYFWKRNDYWYAPPILSAGWTSASGHRVFWGTPFFHRTTDGDGNLLDMHLGLYLEGKDYWGIPPLLTGSWRASSGGQTTWVTPLFHLTTDPEGDVDSLHVGPYLQGKDYWAVPPLLSWHVKYSNNVESTWLTPLFHLTTDAEGAAQSAHLFPAFLWERDAYWVAPPLLTGTWREHNGGRTTWVTPLFHVTTDPKGEAESLHAAPLWFWARDQYWILPPLFTGGGTHADGAHTIWITPLFHRTEDKVGTVESVHAFPVVFWKRDDYWVVPPLLTGGWTGREGSRRTWISPFYHEDYTADGSLRSRHIVNYFDGPDYHHFVPFFWDWKAADNVDHTLVVPPLFVRTAEPSGDVTTSFPWPLITGRSGRTLDTSLGMELRPFLYQDAGDQYEFNFLWRLVSVLSEEASTRVMVGPFWHSEKPKTDDSMATFQILGGLFARDCNYETQRYRYRIFWIIPFGTASMKADP